VLALFESTSDDSFRADYALVTDKKFKEAVKKYAEDEHAFFQESVTTTKNFPAQTLTFTSSFSAAFSRLLELGVPSSQWVTSTPWEMHTLSEQKKD
jgi:cytochrome c peroxidase